MIETWFVVLLVFTGSALTFGSILAGFGEAIERVWYRGEKDPVGRPPLVGLVRQVGMSFENLVPRVERVIDAAERQLVYAGRPYGNLSGAAFVAANVGIGLIFGTILASLLLLLALTSPDLTVASTVRFVVQGFVAGAVLASAAILFILAGRARKVAEEISLEFPFFLDLALLVVQAGGTPQQALKTYVDTSPESYLGKELWVTLREADTRSLDVALGAMSARVQPPSVKLILRNLAQSERSTGKVADFYAEQAVELRTIRYELAERAAERVKVNMTLPTVLMSLAIAFALLAGTIIELQGIV